MGKNTCPRLENLFVNNYKDLTKNFHQSLPDNYLYRRFLSLKRLLMKTLFFTREFPPYVYGGAGVHVEYLSKELAKLMDVEVRCFGDQDENQGTIQVKGYEYGNEKFDNANALLKPVLQTLNANIEMNINEIDARCGSLSYLVQ